MLLASAYLFSRIKTGIHGFINLYCKMYCHIYKYIKHFFSFQKSYFLFEIKKKIGIVRLLYIFGSYILRATRM